MLVLCEVQCFMSIYVGPSVSIILEWTTTSLDSSSGTLICPSLCPRHVGRNNYVPLFGVDPNT